MSDSTINQLRLDSGSEKVQNDGERAQKRAQENPVDTAWENYQKLPDTPEATEANETELYRHFDEWGRLLYVGISLKTLQRLAQHREESAWFKLIHSIKIERWPTRELALLAEKQAIRHERPYFNTHHGSGIRREWKPLNRKGSIKA